MIVSAYSKGCKEIQEQRFTEQKLFQYARVFKAVRQIGGQPFPCVIFSLKQRNEYAIMKPL